jgi:4-hydroxy-tetrahydrodipicolinate synthase
MSKFKGLGTALITPFKNAGDIDYASLDKLIEFQIDAGVDYLVMAGTTGEGATLEDDETLELLKYTKDKLNGRVKIVAGCASNNTKALIKKISKMNELNLDAYLIVSPYYNKPSQEGLFYHYSEAAKAAKDRDIILYNVPGRTSGWIMPETVVLLVTQFENIIAIKEASGDLNFSMNMYKQVSSVSKDFTFLSGDDALTLALISVGYNGVISVVSNEAPREMKKIVDLALKGDFAKARELHYELLPLMNINFIESNPSPVKYAMKKLGYCDGTVRLPLSVLSNTKKMDEVLDNLRNSFA